MTWSGTRNAAGALLLVLCLAFGVLALLQTYVGGEEMAGGQKAPKELTEAQKILAEKAIMANIWRLAAGADIDEAMAKSARKSVLDRWREEVITPYFKDDRTQLHDFFSSAIVLVGRASSEKAVVAFYNPWIDGVFLAAMSADNDTLMMDDFCFISGESWRGETISSADGIFGWYKSKDSLLVSLAKVCSATVARFEQFYPPAAEFIFMPETLKGNVSFQADELAPVKTRMLFRMGMFNQFFSDGGRPILLRTADIMEIIESKGASDLKAALAPSQNSVVLESIWYLPQSIRGAFAPNFFMQREGFAQVALVSPEATRWFIIIDFDLEKPDAERVTLHLFDLNQSAKYLQVIEEGRK